MNKEREFIKQDDKKHHNDTTNNYDMAMSLMDDNESNIYRFKHFKASEIYENVLIVSLDNTIHLEQVIKALKKVDKNLL